MCIRDSYSVSSPESAATILLRDAKYAPEMAEAMQVSARQLKRLGIVDDLISEPVGGAHRDWKAASQLLKDALVSNLVELQKYSIDELMERRYQKYRSIGSAVEHIHVETTASI